MTLPVPPLVGQPFTHPGLPGPATLDTVITGTVNAYGQALRARPGPRLRVSWRGAGTAAAGTRIPFDTVLEDGAAGWDATGHAYTCPLPGVYLCSFRSRVGDSSHAAVTFGPLDTTIYPYALVRTGTGSGDAHGRCAMPPFPVIAAAGDVLACTVDAGDDFVNDATSSGRDRTVLEIQYLGAAPGAAANTLPPDPLVAAQQWTLGEPVSDLTLQRRFAEPADSLNDWVAGFGDQFGLLFASTPTPQSVAAGAPVQWNVDYAAGWPANSYDGQYFTIPDRPVPRREDQMLSRPRSGLWLVSCSLATSTLGQGPSFALGGQLGEFSSNDGANGDTSAREAATCVAVGRFGGQQFDVEPYGPLDVVSTYYRCFLAVVQLG